ARADESSGEYKLMALALPPDAVALVVEDEQDLCELLAEQLSLLGFARVHQLRDGAEVMPLVERLDSPLALVVSDDSLPHVSGREVIAKLAAQGQCNRFLLISGFWGVEELPALPPSIRIERLAKPFSTKRFHEAVRALLS
ncbi:MAG: hypothetical protein CFK52_13435, partial [Chloracidobacterium sp. CP2_5A]